MKGLFITGTNTGVGKTWISKGLIKALVANRVNVVPRKPVESGWPEDIKQSDTWMLANAANQLEYLDQTCPNRFSAAISPERAAYLETKTLSIKALKYQCFDGVKKQQFVYVEGAGGFYSPVCADGLNADLAVALGFPVLLVVSNELGCINHTLLSVEAIKNRNLELLAVVLNDVNLSESLQGAMDNFADLKSRLSVPLFSVENGADSEKIFQQLSELILIGAV